MEITIDRTIKIDDTSEFYTNSGNMPQVGEIVYCYSTQDMINYVMQVTSVGNENRIFTAKRIS